MLITQRNSTWFPRVRRYWERLFLLIWHFCSQSWCEQNSASVLHVPQSAPIFRTIMWSNVLLSINQENRPGTNQFLPNISHSTFQLLWGEFWTGSYQGQLLWTCYKDGCCISCPDHSLQQSQIDNSIKAWEHLERLGNSIINGNWHL